MTRMALCTSLFILKKGEEMQLKFKHNQCVHSFSPISSTSRLSFRSRSRIRSLKLLLLDKVIRNLQQSQPLTASRSVSLEHQCDVHFLQLPTMSTMKSRFPRKSVMKKWSFIPKSWIKRGWKVFYCWVCMLSFLGVCVMGLLRWRSPEDLQAGQRVLFRAVQTDRRPGPKAALLALHSVLQMCLSSGWVQKVSSCSRWLKLKYLFRMSCWTSSSVSSAPLDSSSPTENTSGPAPK